MNIEYGDLNVLQCIRLFHRLYALQDIKIPVLDIHGENDYPSVKGNAPRRLLRMQQAANPKSQQQIIPDANHYFTDKNALLLKQITDWLRRL
jgi:alpha/beta superfamily hydrolase